MTAKRNDNLMTVFEKYFSVKVSFLARFAWGQIFDLKIVMVKLDNYTVDFFYFKTIRFFTFTFSFTLKLASGFTSQEIR